MMKKNNVAGLLLALAVVYMPLPLNAFAAGEPNTPWLTEEKTAEITWSRTSEPYGAIVLPVAKWSWSDVSGINYSKTSGVWDGGSIGKHYIGDASRPWDIATWHTSRPTWNGTADVRRFHGEFTIPEGYSVNDDVTLSSVGDYTSLDLRNIIAINDNIYVFVYPKDAEIDNSNFLSYLAFWTGTACQEAARAVNNGNLITFHDISGTTPYDYKTVTGAPIPSESLLSHTDGWYCGAAENNIGVIMKNSPGAAEFVIDLIIEDFAEDGGMDRMDITFTKVTPNEPEPPESSAPVTEQPDESPSPPPAESADVSPAVSPSASPISSPVVSPAPSPGDTPPPAPGESHIPQDDGTIEVVDDNGVPQGGLIPSGDGTYEVVDDNGTPLGKWYKDDNGQWVYEDMPRTGGLWIPLFALIGGAGMVTAGILLNRRSKNRDGR